MKRCFFVGHRETGSDILPIVRETVIRYRQEWNVREFIVGHYGGFDRIAARAVMEAKKLCPDIILGMLLPYHPEEQKIELPSFFDMSIYPLGAETVPKRFAISYANRYMIDQSDYLIAYVSHSVGNSSQLLEYAYRRERQGQIHVENLFCADGASIL